MDKNRIKMKIILIIQCSSETIAAKHILCFLKQTEKIFLKILLRII